MKVHDWINNGSYQWGMNGGSREDARTNYVCSYCGGSIHLYYNSGDTLEQAMQRVNIPEECPNGVEKLLTGKEKNIFLFCQSEGRHGVSGIAMCEDGRVVGSHFSSDISWLKSDLGYTSTSKHEKYAKTCPEGFELIWVDTEEVQRQYDNKQGEVYDAYVKNQELAKQAELKEETDVKD